MSQAEALRRNGYSPSTIEHASAAICRNPAVRRQVVTFLEDKGMGPDFFVDLHKQAAEGEQAVFYKGACVAKVAPLELRLRAAELGYRLHGMLDEANSFAPVVTMLIEAMRATSGMVIPERRHEYAAVWERLVNRLVSGAFDHEADMVDVTPHAQPTEG